MLSSGNVICTEQRSGLDKGGADLIASGDVKVKQGVQPTGFSNTSLLFEDHTELQADAVIFAYEIMVFDKTQC